MSFSASAREFLTQLFTVLPGLLPRFVLAWALTFVVLICTILWLKKHIHPHVLRADAKIRAWARTLRYEDVTSTGPGSAERHARTWFFRFWTNFASAPSLIVFSILVPIVAYWLVSNQEPSTAVNVINRNWLGPRIFFLPGLCYAGSMLLSFVSKRVFKRVRPERPEGAFGHKLKDGSFPSGHSLTSFAFWIMLSIAVGIFGAPLWVSVLLWSGAILTIILTGLSRIYLGVHFPSDVLGGFSIGLVWCIVCYFTLRPAL